MADKPLKYTFKSRAGNMNAQLPFYQILLLTLSLYAKSALSIYQHERN